VLVLLVLRLLVGQVPSWLGYRAPQDYVDHRSFGLLVAPQNQRREVGMRHALRSSGLLHVEPSLDRVSQSGLKTGGGAMAGGARGTIMEVVSEAS
jgi:hypothetical protein